MPNIKKEEYEKLLETIEYYKNHAIETHILNKILKEQINLYSKKPIDLNDWEKTRLIELQKQEIIIWKNLVELAGSMNKIGETEYIPSNDRRHYSKGKLIGSD